MNLKYLEQDYKYRILIKKIYFGSSQIGSRSNIITSKETLFWNRESVKNEAVKVLIQLLYNEGLFDSFEKKDQIFEAYLTFSDGYLFENYGTEIKTSDGVYYLSDVGYSTREDIYLTVVERR